MNRTALAVSLSLVTLLAIGVGGVVTLLGLQKKISARLEAGWVLTPLELYAEGLPLTPGRRLPRAALEKELAAHGWTVGRDFGFDETPGCVARAGVDAEAAKGGHCLWLREPSAVVTWDDAEWVREIWRDGQPTTHLPLFPRLITQFFDGHPILQENTPLAEVPLACLQAATAIEDRDFLEHRGVSVTGTLRALARNLRKRRWAEGGSTITQQLVKNFFLNPKKTLKRKFEEQALAVLLESQISKDQILEMYLNVIYMGQSGPYQVRGFGAAAHRYFDRAIGDLGLSECALLAALINSPGRYSPVEHAAAARQRRELVLRKMRENEMITPAEFDQASAAPLPTAVDAATTAHAPYFVMSALREFQNWDIESDEGVKLFTTLDVDAQTALDESVAKVLPGVAARVRRPSPQPLQVAALAVDLARGALIALTGGREFKSSPYNRATDARRQIGSTVKPFVYYPAMESKSPLTAVLDEPFEWTVGRQTWRPKNYEPRSLGPVPYFYALATSLNVPAAKVGRDVGLDAVADSIGRAGIRAEVPRLPSLTLGAFELSLAEVAQGFATLARLGVAEDLFTLTRVETTAGEVLFRREVAAAQSLDPKATAVVVGMLRQTFELGTARATRALGLVGDYAGKTGTTSDTKDAWFIGFDGGVLSAVWVGYDDNTPTGLTGAGAALPIWTELTKRLQRLYEPRGFAWPAGASERVVGQAELGTSFPSVAWPADGVRLIFAEEGH